LLETVSVNLSEDNCNSFIFKKKIFLVWNHNIGDNLLFGILFQTIVLDS